MDYIYSICDFIWSVTCKLLSARAYWWITQFLYTFKPLFLNVEFYETSYILYFCVNNRFFFVKVTIFFSCDKTAPSYAQISTTIYRTFDAEWRMVFRLQLRLIEYSTFSQNEIDILVITKQLLVQLCLIWNNPSVDADSVVDLMSTIWGPSSRVV